MWLVWLLATLANTFLFILCRKFYDVAELRYGGRFYSTLGHIYFSVCISERIIKIGQYLPKLCSNVKVSSFFLTHSVYHITHYPTNFRRASFKLFFSVSLIFVEWVLISKRVICVALYTPTGTNVSWTHACFNDYYQQLQAKLRFLWTSTRLCIDHQ